ncbi:hypothetical protein CY34DRAFT_86510 [Suillus luteus UH-Slu-Lm8-n1]|uniref:Heterokaryon incompatibility domain-containing protein n=1 Tax=Suillus luteus UH-Slu-Lm8-n1 TaxID=930992 RepID=A0A0D0ARZ6_9AGAM|nr:hypothetical protein CY34DRAFT_86510 [Suillus luteus UH-Slu-Lm8-n1]
MQIRSKLKYQLERVSKCSPISSELYEQYVSPSEADSVIRKSIDVQLDNNPLRLLNTTTGLICDREAQICTFKSSTEYHELLLALTTKHPNIRMERIPEVVALYFRYVMLSHRWGEKEPLLHDISGKIVFELEAAGGIAKLQSFCEIARKAEYRWAWVDSCCIDQHNIVELQKSLNSMFVWYYHSALTIVYLSDVPPLSKSGAMAKSAWNTRGWTVPEFLAPKAIRFYQQDWTLYLDNSSPNHKESVEIMHELEVATGIDARTLIEFQPGMKDAREKLQWASTRVTTLPEDIAYSLFGIFGIQLPILYGENKQNALGRLLQEIVARSGDITALDWVGQPSEFNSCLPASITSYAIPPCHSDLPILSEDELQTAVSSLQQQNTVAVELALRLHTLLDNMSAPRFANCRLHLPCITFRVTEIKRRRGTTQTCFTYGVKADGLQDLLITSEQTLVQFSRTKPTRWTFLLVRPWDQDLADSESCSRALRLIVRLGQPFSAFLLAQQRGGEYRRIASDQVIIAQVKDVASVQNMMDIRTPEVL